MIVSASDNGEDDESEQHRVTDVTRVRAGRVGCVDAEVERQPRGNCEHDKACDRPYGHSRLGGRACCLHGTH